MSLWIVTYVRSRDPTHMSIVVHATSKENAAEECRRRFNYVVKVLSVHFKAHVVVYQREVKK